MMKHSYALALALAAGGLTLGSAATAQEHTRSAGVTYSDLDLSTQEGVEELDRRIDRAARQVCELDQRDLGTRIRSREARACYEEAKRSIDERFSALIREARMGG